MLPSHLCSHSSLYSTEDPLFARAIIAIKRKKMTMLLFFFKVCLVLLGFKVYTSKSFGFHVQYWREVNFKVNHFTVVCVRRAISSASVVLIHYYRFWTKTSAPHVWVRSAPVENVRHVWLSYCRQINPGREWSNAIVYHKQCNSGMRTCLLQLIYLKNFLLFCKRRLCFSHHSIFCTAVHTN